MSRETGRPVDTVIVRLLPQLICLPLWRLGLSRPITRGEPSAGARPLISGRIHSSSFIFLPDCNKAKSDFSQCLNYDNKQEYFHISVHFFLLLNKQQELDSCQ